MQNKIVRITTMGLLVAAQVVLARFLAISTPFVRIGFSFVPVVLAALLYGPIWAGIGCAAADMLGALLFPAGGAFFPGFTLSAFLTGVLYGLILYKKPKSLWRILAAAAAVSLGVNLCLNTYWLFMITGKAYLALIVPRILQNAIVIPVKVITIHLLLYRLADLVDLGPWREAA